MSHSVTFLFNYMQPNERMQKERLMNRIQKPIEEALMKGLVKSIGDHVRV